MVVDFAVFFMVGRDVTGDKSNNLSTVTKLIEVFEYGVLRSENPLR